MITNADLDALFIRVAETFSELAHCTHRNVGAVVVSDEGRIWGHGYNKPAWTGKRCDKGDCPRGLLAPGQGAADYSDCITVHAEISAMMMAGSSLCEGSTLYVNSEPCIMCFRVAEAQLIRRIVWSSANGPNEIDTLSEKQF
jgi:dCMP deaminase